MVPKFKISKLLSFVMAMALMLCFAFGVSAKNTATKAPLTTLSARGDLTVMFEFDVENVDISFISPSGDIYTKDSQGVEFAEGDLWATYKIVDAIPGPWKVSYNLGDNTVIDYTILESQEGIFIQSFDILGVEDDELKVSFIAEVGENDVSYDFEVGIINEDGQSVIVGEGSADTKEEATYFINLNRISSGEYTPYLNVYYEGEIEVFDTVEGSKFTYENPNTPDAISDFVAFMDTAEAFVTLNWGSYDSYGMDSFEVRAYSNDELFTRMSVEDGDSTTIAYPTDAKTLKIELYYYDNGLRSKACTKEIDLVNGEYLKLVTGEATGSAGAELEVKVSQDRYMLIFINEQPDENTLSDKREDLENWGELVTTEDKTLYIPFTDGGNNSVYLELFAGNNIVFTVDKTIFYDMYPPAITLYENLNNKTFADADVSIIGKVSDCAKLLINKTEVLVSQSGEFKYTTSLSGGKNTITIEAYDVNENGSVMTLSLYRQSAAQNIAAATKSLTTDYLPLLISAAAGLTAFIIFLVSLKGKKDKENKKSLGTKLLTAARFISVIAFLAGTADFVRRTIFIHSIKYLDLAEESVRKAADYINARNTAFIVAIASLIIFILLLVLPKKLKGNKAPKPKKEKKNKKDKNNQ